MISVIMGVNQIAHFLSQALFKELLDGGRFFRIEKRIYQNDARLRDDGASRLLSVKPA